MTAFFPNPLPDELLYSAVARYRDMLRLPNEKMLLESLFGSATMVASVEFTGHVDTWLERLPPGHPLTATAVIRSHTTLPYYRPFLPPDRGSDAEERLRSRGGASVCEILGVRASTVPNPPRLRFCPACATEDRECHGSPCWRRVHQLPGVFLCPRHLNVLWESSVSRSPGVHRHAFVSLAEAIHGHSTPLPVAADFAELLGTLARQSRWLLDETPIPPGLATLNARYRALLAERGWVRGKCQLRMAELRDAFVSGTGRRLLALLGCALPVRSHDAEADDWFARLLRRPRTAHHPLRHLLLMRFLGIQPAEFFALKPSRAPAALIPMPAPVVTCRNRVCSSESAGSRVTAGGARIVSCRRCGFTCMERDGRRLRVLRYGPVWERRLGELVAMPEATLRSIALQLGVDTNTVKRQAQRLGVQRPTWRARHTSSESPADRRKALGRHRKVWEQLRVAHPLEGRSTLRERAPATYTYLRRYDRTWFEQHQPPRARTDCRRPRVDWRARDAEMFVLARAAISRLKGRTRPVRISQRAIAREMGHISLIEQHLDRIPETAAFLRDAVESRVEFAARKVALIGAARAGKDPLPRWILVRRANLRPELLAAVADELELWTSTEGGCP